MMMSIILLTAMASVQESPDASIDRLIDEIESNWCEVREDPHDDYFWTIKEHFDELAEPGTSALLKMLASPPRNRRCAMGLVTSLRKKDAIPQLWELANDPSAEVDLRAASLSALDTLGGLDVDKLITLASTVPDRRLFTATMRGLTEFPQDERARSAIRKMFHRSDLPDGMKGFLVVIVGQMRDPDSVPLLVTMSSDLEDRDRFAVARSLAQIGTPESREAALVVCRNVDGESARRAVAGLVKAELTNQSSAATASEEEQLAGLIRELTAMIEDTK